LFKRSKLIKFGGKRKPLRQGDDGGGTDSQKFMLGNQLKANSNSDINMNGDQLKAAISQEEH
jgi:hypothetical protein